MLSKLNNKLNNKLNLSNKRSINVINNIVASFIIKGGNIIISLLIVSLTINYVTPTRYGIWLTVTSIIGWITYFDMGFTHGFRNKFAEAKAKGDTVLGRKLVSTTYVLLGLVFGILLLIALIVNSRLNWSKILNIDVSINKELSIVFYILISFFCIQMILNTFLTLLIASQKTAFSSLINTIGQFLALFMILLLTKTTEGNLINLSLALVGIPCSTILIFTIIFFHTKYKDYSPSLKHIDFCLIKDILGLGSKFFVIQISMLFIFQFVNIILLQYKGAEEVSIYNITYKYFNTILMVTLIILTPLWPSFTEAYTQKDFNWMKQVYDRLSKKWYLAIVAYIGMLIISPWIYKIWISNAVLIPYTLSAMMGVYILLVSRANLYMYLINGIGKIQIQLIIYLSFSVISIPVLIFLTKYWGSIGILIFLSSVYLVQAVILHIQINKIISNKAKGIWDR